MVEYHEELLLGYLEGTLSADQKAIFEQQLYRDARLRNLVAQLVLDRNRLRSLGNQSPPEDLMQPVWQWIDEHGSSARPTSPTESVESAAPGESADPAPSSPGSLAPEQGSADSLSHQPAQASPNQAKQNATLPPAPSAPGADNPLSTPGLTNPLASETPNQAARPADGQELPAANINPPAGEPGSETGTTPAPAASSPRRASAGAAGPRTLRFVVLSGLAAMILVSAGLFLQALAPSTPLLNVRELLTQSPAESANLALNDPASAKQADTAGAAAQAGTPESAESPDPAAVFPSTTPSNEAASQDLEPLNGAPQALALTTEPPGAAQARHRTGEQRPATAQPTAQPDMPAKPADAATAEVSAAASSPSAESTVPAVEPADAPATASPGETAAPLLELPEPAVPTGDQAAAADRESADQPQPPQPQAEPANHPQPMALPQPPAGPLTGQLRREVAADPNPVRLHVASYDPQQAADAIGQWAQAHGVTVLSQTLTDRPTLRLRLTAGQLPRLLAHLSRSPQHLALLQTGPTPIGQQQANWKRELIGELPLSPAVRLDHPDVVMELPIIVTERAQPLPPPTPSPPPLAPSTSHPTPSAPGQLPPPPAAEPPRPQPQ